MQTILIPASYDVWLTGLKDHLTRHSGSHAKLAHYLETAMEIKFTSAKVKVSQMLSGKFIPAAGTFIDIAAWLQRQADALNDPPHFTPLASAPVEKNPPPTSWRSGVQSSHRHSTRVAEDPPQSNSQAG